VRAAIAKRQRRQTVVLRNAAHQGVLTHLAQIITRIAQIFAEQEERGARTDGSGGFFEQSGDFGWRRQRFLPSGKTRLVDIQIPDAPAQGFGRSSTLFALRGLGMDKNKTAAPCAAGLAPADRGRKGVEEFAQFWAVAAWVEGVVIQP
jgi:hypothetical protein